MNAMEYCDTYGGTPADVMDWEPNRIVFIRRCLCCGKEIVCPDEVVVTHSRGDTYYYHEDCYREFMEEE